MSNIREQIAFLEEVADLEEEFNAAYETRKEDPERWDAAKHAYQAARSNWRGVFRAFNPTGDGSTVVAGATESATEIHGKEV